MLARNRQTIYELTRMLRALEKNPADYALLLALQQKLVEQIRRTERRIASLKLKRQSFVRDKASRQSKEDALRTKQKLSATSESIADANHLLFLWRCFGDGIAFLYIDKMALKHMFYNTQDYLPKQAAGAISEKDGFRREWSILKSILKTGYPAVLCDLTNTVRHGDICVLVGPDPLPLEVKSSMNRNARVDRQIASLKALTDFYRTDAATDFRGLPHVMRVEVPGTTENHSREMNLCIKRSKRTGFASVSPEAGLAYACIRTTDFGNKLNRLIRPRTIFYTLNERKSSSAWMPYYPFTLSIRDAEALYEFMNGEITLAVFLHTDAVVDVFREKGLEAKFVQHPQISIVVNRQGVALGQGAMNGISTGYFERLFLDFHKVSALVEMELAQMTFLESQFLGQSDTGVAQADELSIEKWRNFEPMWPDSQAEKS